MTYTSKNITSSNTVEGEYNEVVPRIWTINPSYKDINITLIIVKVSFAILIFSFMMIYTYILSKNYIASITLGICSGLLFDFIFHDQFFFFSYIPPGIYNRIFSFFLPGISKQILKFNPFNHFVFWVNKDDPTSIFYSNRSDLTHTGMRIFKINIIPDNVHEVINHFIKSLSNKDVMINFTYQIVHNPVIGINNIKNEALEKEQNDSYTTSIYFCIYETKNGLLGNIRYSNMVNKLDVYSKVLKGVFVADFHHFNIILLSGSELIKALQVFFLNGINYSPTEKNDHSLKKNDKILSILKLMFLFYLLLYFDFILLTFQVNGVFVMILDVVILAFFIFYFWREILFIPFYRKKSHARIDPFGHIKFYYYKKIPYSIFIHINKSILINYKLYNLLYSSSPFFNYPNKFVQAILYHKIPFSYSLVNSPMTYNEFSKEGFEYLNEKTIYSLTQSNWKIKNKNDEIQWLSMRSGMWKTILNISLFDYEFATRIDKNTLSRLDEQLNLNSDVMRRLFASNFQNFELTLLKKRTLISGLLCTFLKNKDFRRGGSHLNYLIFQGKLLNKLVETADEYKKGVKTRIGSEFNTPLYLENFIRFGHTLNTEVLEKEVPVGLTYEQTKNILIANGIFAKRELLSMKIVSEGIKKGLSFLIFDFSGNWSRLINQFKNSVFEKEILHFKLGYTFTLNPKFSDIAHDKNNLEYLNYMLDAFAIAFKRDDREIEMLKNSISLNPKDALEDMDKDISTKKNNYKSLYYNDSFKALFSNFTENYAFFSKIKPENAKNEIYPYHFIKLDKTVILDLSKLRDIKTQLFFVFLVISKILHYMYYADDYTTKEKTVVIPYIDAFFDQRHLYYKTNYTKAYRFIAELTKYNFGLIFSSHQVYDIHSSVLKYFNNIITFKTTDNRDLAVLSNLMNLQELVGKGVYSNYRNQTYQLTFLKTLINNEIIMKRSDIHQPFSAIIEVNDIKESKPLDLDNLMEHMKRQGYDLKNKMLQILKEAKKTLFDKDLGEYILYFKEIIEFFKDLEAFEGIGNSYETKLKNELKNYIAPKARQKGLSNQNIKELRDSIFNVLTKHRYLEEDHSLRAGGSESLRTSYKIGSQYQKALKDYIETKHGVPNDIVLEMFERESIKPPNSNKLFGIDNPSKEVLENDLKKAFEIPLRTLNYNIFKVYGYISQAKFREAFNLEYKLIEKYLKEVYKEYYNSKEEVNNEDLEKFILHLSKDNEFPIIENELVHFLEYPSVSEKEGGELEKKVKKIYNHIYKFIEKIKVYILHE